jgi:hypothetical protein
METNMIYINRHLNANLTYLTLVGQDEEGRLEWAGKDEQWYQADRMSIPPSQLHDMEDTAESDDYDLSTNYK